MQNDFGPDLTCTINCQAYGPSRVSTQSDTVGALAIGLLRAATQVEAERAILGLSYQAQMEPMDHVAFPKVSPRRRSRARLVN
jgi:hypothetical protein